jgi:hypothetical protein
MGRGAPLPQQLKEDIENNLNKKKKATLPPLKGHGLPHVQDHKGTGD